MIRIESCSRQIANVLKLNLTKPCMLKGLKKFVEQSGSTAAQGICERCQGDVQIGEFDKNSSKSLTKQKEED